MLPKAPYSTLDSVYFNGCLLISEKCFKNKLQAYLNFCGCSLKDKVILLMPQKLKKGKKKV